MVDAFDWYLPNATNWSIRDEQSFPIIAYKYVEIHYWEDPAPFQEDIYIRAHNSCGWSNWKRTTWPVVNHCGGWLLVLTPNPSAGETTVSIESASAESPHINTGWDLEVYDQSQQLKVKKTRLKGPAYALNTMGWKDGIYIIRVNYNGELLTGKLAVKEQ
ncbi:T9SS type A sorting domain-containing protein [Gaoshiqia sp. Z1-71]|uniref:T9SS type A sorting domain-containing protein n=1 Tax=Gaoshiqia hydrogeniformans TaxID=3290090 RepID=UPI003BF8CC57